MCTRPDIYVLLDNLRVLHYAYFKPVLNILSLLIIYTCFLFRMFYMEVIARNDAFHTKMNTRSSLTQLYKNSNNAFKRLIITRFQNISSPFNSLRAFIEKNCIVLQH